MELMETVARIREHDELDGAIIHVGYEPMEPKNTNDGAKFIVNHPDLNENKIEVVLIRE